MKEIDAKVFAIQQHAVVRQHFVPLTAWLYNHGFRCFAP
jgi:hypothetical protein